MSFVPGFEYDIFISYAHVDNEEAEEKGWVERFHKYLKIELDKQIGRPELTAIWRDPALKGNQLFDKTIQDQINASALFLALTSRGFLESEYCRKELNRFLEKAKKDHLNLVVGENYSRIFNQLLYNIPHKEWPDEYGGESTGFKFYDEFGYPLNPGSEPFKNQVRSLVKAIHKTLCACKKKVAQKGREKEQGEQKEKEEEQGDSDVVYFSDVTDSLRKNCRRAMFELQEKGIHVVNNVPPPYEAKPHEEKVINELERAILSVHLLDQFEGREIDGEPGKYYPQKQVEIAIKQGKHQFIWVPEQLDINSVEDETYRSFLNGLGNRKEGNYDFVRDSPTSLTRQVVEKIEQIKATRFQSYSVSNTPSILINTHRKDDLYAIELTTFLGEKHIPVLINPEDDDPKTNIDKFQERLKKASALIIIFGQVEGSWVQERLNEALQLIITKQYPLQSFGIYVAPPPKQAKSILFNQHLFKIHVLDNSAAEQPTSQVLKPFLEAIGLGRV